MRNSSKKHSCKVDLQELFEHFRNVNTNSLTHYDNNDDVNIMCKFV